MEEVMKQIAEFNKEREWDKFHTPENLAKCISIEAAELLLYPNGDETWSKPRRNCFEKIR